jgi:hypothetical protein
MADQIDHLHVICYKWASLYAPAYVNTLANMVRRNLDTAHTFHCITDDAAGLDPRIQTHTLPNFGFEGIWRKLMTFQDDFLGLNGHYVVSIDLDVVIVDSLNFLAEQPDKDFIIARNWSKSGVRGSGSLYRLKVGSHTEIWDQFITDPEKAIDNHHGKNRLIGEQKWLNAHFKEFNFLPDGKVVSYKRHCKSKGRIIRIGNFELLNTARFGKASTPDGASLISFHGDPSPPDVMNQASGKWRHAPFVKEHWQ